MGAGIDSSLTWKTPEMVAAEAQQLHTMLALAGLGLLLYVVAKK